MKPVTPRILIVDDTPATVRLLTAYLVSDGYEVLTAHAGPDAVELARSAAPELVLLDLVASRADRRELCVAIKAAVRALYTPVIVSVDAEDAEERTKLRDGPADDLIGKPYQRSELLLRVGSMLRIRKLREQLEERTGELASARALLRQHCGATAS